jgi:hypothetical protein
MSLQSLLQLLAREISPDLVIAFYQATRQSRWLETSQNHAYYSEPIDFPESIRQPNPHVAVTALTSGRCGIAQNDLTKMSATPDRTQSAIARANQGLVSEEGGQPAPAEDGEPEIGPGRRRGDEHQPPFPGGAAIPLPYFLRRLSG